jgi:hypothetical protein
MTTSPTPLNPPPPPPHTLALSHSLLNNFLPQIVERREWHEVLAERDLDHTLPVPEPLEFRCVLMYIF